MNISMIIMLIVCMVPSLLNSMDPNRLWEACHNGISHAEWARQRSGAQEKLAQERAVRKQIVVQVQPQQISVTQKDHKGGQ